jgi:hypothetical protein
MRRPVRGGDESSFSLFPFLAVLLCTMGALVVLLVAMANVSRANALREADARRAAAQAADASPRLEQARKALAEARAFRAKLDEAGRQVSQRLADEQQRLQAIEKHVRTLQDEVLKLRAEAEELFKLEEAHVDDREMAQRELERLKKLADQLDKEVEQMRVAAKGRERRYAIVPLRDGLGGSNRPAVYFECVADGVVLQPEGVKLTMADFRPPVHVSSPLAAAIRAVERYYRDHPEARAAGEEGSPYPLLVVRPDGVLSFNRARGVFDALDADYGYQPVAQEWPIAYETPNPVMAEQVSRAIDLARLERERLAEAAPQLFRSRGPGEDSPNDPSMSRGSFADAGLTTPGGGLPGAASTNTGNPFAGLAPEIPRNGRGGLGTGRGGPVGEMGTGARAGLAGGSPVPRGVVSQGAGQGGQATGPAVLGGDGVASTRGDASSDTVGPSLGSTGAVGDPTLQDPLSTPGPTGGAGRAGGGEGGWGGGPGLAGGPDSNSSDAAAASALLSGSPNGAQGASSAIGAATAGGEGGGQGPSLGGDGQPGGSPGGSSLAGSPSSSEGTSGSQSDQQSAAGSQSGMPPSMLDSAAPPSATAIAQSSSNSAPTAKSTNRSGVKGRDGVAMVRPIRLLVTRDSLAIVSERVLADGTRGMAPGEPVSLGDSAYAARDAVFGALKRHADSWGIPGDGMFWQPRLTLNVAPGGEARAAELANLFQSAGLSVDQATASTGSGSGGSNATQTR